MRVPAPGAVAAVAALDAGAAMVNDVFDGLTNSDMAGLVAEAGCPWTLMQWSRGAGCP